MDNQNQQNQDTSIGDMAKKGINTVKTATDVVKTGTKVATSAAKGVATGGTSVITDTIKKLLTTFAKLFKEDKKEKGIVGFYSTIFFLIILLIIFLLVAVVLILIFTLPLALVSSMNKDDGLVDSRTILNDEQRIERYIEERQQDEEKIEEMMRKMQLLNESNDMDNANLELSKEMINLALRDAISDKCISLLSYSNICEDIFTDYSLYETLENFMEKPFPYALRKEDGSYYTVKDAMSYEIGGNKDLFNDVNYAEIISVISQRPDNSVDSFTFANYYDILFSKDISDLLYEIKWEGTKWYASVINPSAKTHYVLTCNENHEHEGDFITGGACFKSVEITYPSSEVECKSPEEAKRISDNVYYIRDCTLLPYGLEELYSLCGVDAFATDDFYMTFNNLQVLDENERWLRAIFYDKDLGPSFESERSERSIVYDIIKNTNKNASAKAYLNYPDFPTGRSLYNYMDESLTAEYIGTDMFPWKNFKAWEGYDYVPTGESVILQMFDYINQGDYATDMRGTSNETIKQSGCCDCSYTMCAMYYTQKPIDIKMISKNYVRGDHLQTANFLDNYGLSQKRESFDMTTIVNAITEGKPVVLYIRGYWEYNGVTYHKTKNGHFLVIVGYDATGLYVYDPGSRKNTQSGAIPYEAFPYVSDKHIRIVSTNDAGFIPKYHVNTIAEGGKINE